MATTPKGIVSQLMHAGLTIDQIIHLFQLRDRWKPQLWQECNHITSPTHLAFARYLYQTGRISECTTYYIVDIQGSAEESRYYAPALILCESCLHRWQGTKPPLRLQPQQHHRCDHCEKN